MSQQNASVSAQALHIEAEEQTSTLLHEWLDAKTEVKAAEKVIEALKPKMWMLIPVETGVRTFAATLEKKGKILIGKLVVKKASQDRRKPDPAKLTALLLDKNAPPEAFKQVADEDYVAKMIDEGKISLAEFRACLAGKLVEYPQVDFVEEAVCADE